MSKAQKAEKGTLKKVLNYIKPYWALVALSILLSAAVVGLTLYVPVLIGRAIDRIIGPGQVDFAAVMALLVRIGVIVAATAGLQWLVNSINNKIAYQVVRDVRASRRMSRTTAAALCSTAAHCPTQVVRKPTATSPAKMPV